MDTAEGNFACGDWLLLIEPVGELLSVADRY